MLRCKNISCKFTAKHLKEVKLHYRECAFLLWYCPQCKTLIRRHLFDEHDCDARVNKRQLNPNQLTILNRIPEYSKPNPLLNRPSNSPIRKRYSRDIQPELNNDTTTLIDV